MCAVSGAIHCAEKLVKCQRQHAIIVSQKKVFFCFFENVHCIVVVFFSFPFVVSKKAVTA